MKKRLWIPLLIFALIGLGFISARTPDLSREAAQEKYTNDASRFIVLPSGNNIHYRDEGAHNKPALFLVHGSNASLHTWETWVDELSRDYRLISIDLPGHGLTGAVADADYSIKAMADTIKQLADYLQIDTFALAGNSMGGVVITHLALAHPERVTALILISASVMTRDAEDNSSSLVFTLLDSSIGRFILRYVTSRSLIENALRKTVAAPDDFVTDAMVTRYWDLARMRGTWDATVQRFSLKRPSLQTRLSEIKAPTLILWGEYDTLTLPKYAPRLKDAISESTLIMYDNAGHLAMEEIPAQSAKDTHVFLQNTLN